MSEVKLPSTHYFVKKQFDATAAYFYMMGSSLQHFVMLGVIWYSIIPNLDEAIKFDEMQRPALEQLKALHPKLAANIDLNICQSDCEMLL